MSLTKLIVKILKNEANSGYVIIRDEDDVLDVADSVISIIQRALVELSIKYPENIPILLTCDFDEGYGTVRAQTPLGILQIYANYNVRKGAPPQYIHAWMVKRF